MKISIWQQFSSNHSANYTVIGVFDSIEKAQQITTQLKQLVDEITAWYKDNPQVFGDGNWQPTPVEKELSESLGIEWKEPVDWLYLYGRSERTLDNRKPESFIEQLDHCVFVNAPGSETWQTGKQFIGYLKSHGATTYREVYMGYSPEGEEPVFEGLDVTLYCKVPDEETLNQLDKVFHIRHLGHIMQRFDDTDAPWIVHHPHYSEANIRHDSVFTIERITIKADTIIFDGLSAVTISYALPAVVQWLRSLNCSVTYELKQNDA